MISASPTGPATLSIDAWPATPIRDQGVQNAPHGAEQTDERRDRTDRSEEGDAALQLAIGVFELAVQGHADPVVDD